MRPCAITTRFAHAAPLSPEEILARTGELGASGLVLDRQLDRERLELLTAGLERRRESLPVVAVEAAVGTGRLPGPCARDRGEVREAMQAVGEAIRRAGRLGAAVVVVHLGAIAGLQDGWRELRGRFLRGRLAPGLALAAARARDREALPHLDVARATLDRLCREAQDEGVTLCLANRRRYVELPSARELDLLVAELRGAPLRPLLKVHDAHLLDLMGFEPLALSLAAFCGGPIAYHGDACGPIGGLPPGRGLIDLGALADKRLTEEQGTLVFDPWPGLELAELREAVASPLLGAPATS